MAKTSRICVALIAVAVAAAGCSKKEGGKSEGAAPKKEGAASKSGLAWEPEGYAKMSETCRKALACCEELAKNEGAASASDYNLKCSGPALWKDDECATDLVSRAGLLESEGKPVPAACK